MEDYKICSYYLSEKKEYKCISCGKLLDNNKGYSKNICENVNNQH